MKGGGGCDPREDDLENPAQAGLPETELRVGELEVHGEREEPDERRCDVGGDSLPELAAGDHLGDQRLALAARVRRRARAAGRYAPRSRFSPTVSDREILRPSATCRRPGATLRKLPIC